MNKIIITAPIVLAILIGACQQKKDVWSNEQGVTDAKAANDSSFTDRSEENDADFVVNTIAGNWAEIKMAQLAKNKSGNADIQSAAGKLEEQHMKMITELRAYADKKGIAIPLEETNRDANELADLDQETSQEFDEAWCKQMRQRHEKSIRRFEARGKRTDEQELREWINATLPELKAHLDIIESVQNER